MERPGDLVVARLILQRQRRAGVPFGEAWEKALAALPEPERNGRPLEHRDIDRSYSLSALEKTREAWESAYLRRPAPIPEKRSTPVGFYPDEGPQTES
jgi:hypothetical protein